MEAESREQQFGQKLGQTFIKRESWGETFGCKKGNGAKTICGSLTIKYPLWAKDSIYLSGLRYGI